MKRNHGLISSTPLFLQKKGRTSSRQHGFLGTPVEGLTGMPIDTPDSDDRPQRAIPETTQRRLEGFCLNTPLTLSQVAEQETPTLVKEQPAQQQHDDDAAEQKQQRSGRKQPVHHKLQQQQQQPQHLGTTGLQTAQARHRLANISNLPPTPAAAAAAAAAAASDAAAAAGSPTQPSSCGPQPMATGGTTGGRLKRRQHAFFQPGVLSPPQQPQQYSQRGLASSQRVAPSLAAAAAAGAARTPHPNQAGSSFLLAAPTPGSCGGAGDDDCGFVLFTSQSYVRQSQPAISPSFAAGLSAGPEEEPNTTPSQDSREPRLSPSHATVTTTTTGSMSFDLSHPLVSSVAAAASGVPAAAAAAADAGPVSSSQQEQPLTASQVTAPDAVRPGGAAGSSGGVTPADGLGLLLRGGPDLEETTTPELELVGIVPNSQEVIGGSQQQLQHPGSAAAGAAAAAAGTAAGAAGPGSSRAAAGAAAAAGRAGVRAAGGAGAGGSSGRGRGPGVVCEEVTAKQMLFPVFRPLKERKCVILVRHGESTYNKQDAVSKSWADPKIFDAPLTQRGRQQAVAARERLSELLKKHGHLGSTLWLSSPLTRALETMTLAAPHVEQLAAAQHGMGAPKVVVSSLISEHCATSGDVGRPASHLRTRFPSLLSAMADLEEVWWFNPAPDDNPNCAVTGAFNKTESIDAMRHRVSEFASWLRRRPEQVVVAFGHSTFWKYFSNSRTRLRNCEVMQMWW